MSLLASPYAAPRTVTDLSDCWFYHTMDVPGYGEVQGQWDLRPNVSSYLGGVKLHGKRVLEVGTANGYLCTHMEQQGAEVVACDLSESDSWDIVPFAGKDNTRAQAENRQVLRRLNNAFWLGHAAHKSRARVVYGPVYAIPDSIGVVDVATYCAVLLHLRDPFGALAAGLRLTRETAVVTEWHTPRGIPEPLTNVPALPPLPALRRPPLARRAVNRVRRLLAGRQVIEHTARQAAQQTKAEERRAQLARADMIFLPDHRTGYPTDTWWEISPEAVCRFLGILGFGDTTVTYHTQFFQLTGEHISMYTVVGRRTSGAAIGIPAAA